MSKHLSRISAMRRDYTVTTKFSNPTTILDPVQISLKPHKSCTRSLHQLQWVPSQLRPKADLGTYSSGHSKQCPTNTKFSNPTIILKKQIRTKQNTFPPPRLLHACRPRNLLGALAFPQATSDAGLKGTNPHLLGCLV